MALSCRFRRRQPRQLSGVKRTSHFDRAAAASDSAEKCPLGAMSVHDPADIKPEQHLRPVVRAISYSLPGRKVLGSSIAQECS